MPVKLNSGFDMPLVGFGTFLAKPNEAGQSVSDAIKAGYRHIDCASAYQVGGSAGARRVLRRALR